MYKKTWQGIEPQVLLQQIQNTVPFLFSEREENKIAPNQRYLEILYAVEKKISENKEAQFSHYEYFEFCLVAHFVTVGSFVPTDVDNQIRYKIWQTSPDWETKLAMATLIEEMKEWDILPVAARFVKSISDDTVISGIEGEWLGEMVAAYASLRKKEPKKANQYYEKILEDLEQQKKIISEYKKLGNGIEVVKSAALIAHNLGDLDRVMDMWALPEEDKLRVSSYKIGHQANETFSDFFLWVGRMNKHYMAAENHRHLPLREPRILRTAREFLLPIGPFFDDWGKIIAKDPRISERDLAEVMEALIKGFERLGGVLGYARALAGIENNFPGGQRSLEKILPRGLAKNWQSGRLRALISEPQERFEARWRRISFHPHLNG